MRADRALSYLARDLPSITPDRPRTAVNAMISSTNTLPGPRLLQAQVPYCVCSHPRGPHDGRAGLASTHTRGSPCGPRSESFPIRPFVVANLAQKKAVSICDFLLLFRRLVSEAARYGTHHGARDRLLSSVFRRRSSSRLPVGTVHSGERLGLNASRTFAALC